MYVVCVYAYGETNLNSNEENGIALVDAAGWKMYIPIVSENDSTMYIWKEEWRLFSLYNEENIQAAFENPS